VPTTRAMTPTAADRASTDGDRLRIVRVEYRDWSAESMRA